jgi:pyridoxine 4-dehydrogenase
MSMRRLGLDHIDLYYLHTPAMTDAPFEEIVEMLAGMREEGLIRHIGLSKRQRRSASDRDVDHRHRRRDGPLQRRRPARRRGTAGRRARRHRLLTVAPGAVPGGEDGRPFHAVIDPIAAKYDATPQQIALAWQLHRTAQALPIPGTTSVEHLRENLAAAHIALTRDEVDAITALAPEED